MIDLVQSKVENVITLQDLKACGLAHVFFMAFVNLSKFIEYEQRDPFTDKVIDITF